MHGTLRQEPCGAAVNAGEVMVIPLGWGEESLSTGQMAATHQAPLLQLTQMAIDGGQPHRPIAAPQPGVEILAGQLGIGLTKGRQQMVLSGREPGFHPLRS